MGNIGCPNCDRHNTLRLVYSPVPDVRFYKCNECGYIPIEGKEDIRTAWDIWNTEETARLLAMYR